MMTVQFKNPSDQEAALMREFGTLISNGVDMVMRHDIANIAGVVVQKLQEAMFWHSHGLLNKEPVKKDDAPLEGELQQANPTVN